MPVLVKVIAIAACGYMTANAAYMLVSPQSWARAEWTAKGTLNAFEDPDVQVREAGRLIRMVGVIILLLSGSVLFVLVHSLLT